MDKGFVEMPPALGSNPLCCEVNAIVGCAVCGFKLCRPCYDRQTKIPGPSFGRNNIGRGHPQVHEAYAFLSHAHAWCEISNTMTCSENADGVLNFVVKCSHIKDYCYLTEAEICCPS